MNPNWDERYSQSDFAYGKTPNVFFKDQLTKLQAGKMLMPADGEGRNGVYAATQGWDVTCFDLSKEGKAKAHRLAEELGTELNSYHVGDFEGLDFDPDSFDAIGLIYAHFPGSKKLQFHQKLDSYLKKGGTIILEAYSKSHLPLVQADPRVGGPRNLDDLFSIAEIESYFPTYEMEILEEVEVQLSEGLYHNGIGSVIRFVGRKS